MTQEELDRKVEAAAEAMVHESLKGIEPNALLKVTALSKCVATMCILSGWDIDSMVFEIDPWGHLSFRCLGESRCLAGYNTAYQVKLVLEALEDAGMFR